MPAPAVGFDVTPLLGPQTGIGRSVRELADALDVLPNGPRRIAYALGRPAHRSELPTGARLLAVPTRVLLAAWSRTDRPRVDRVVPGASVLHATAFVAPPSRLPTLVSVHDCAFALHPETVVDTVHAFDPLLRRAVARGAHVHTTTHQVAREVQELLGTDLSGRLHVVPWAIPRLGTATKAGAGRPYVLALGSQDPRKNLPALIRAFAQLDGDLGLVLAGSPGRGTAAVDQALAALAAQVRDRIDVRGSVDEATRLQLLSGAAVLAYPSLYEGFGFPLLEAMSLGVPALASDLPVLREVAQDGAVYAAPTDEGLAEGIRQALTRATVARGREVAATYSWERTASELTEVYRGLSAST